MEILKIYQEEELLINYYVIKPLILLKILNMVGIKEPLLQWLKILLIERLLLIEEQGLIIETNN